MADIKQVEYGKIPKGTEGFFLIRQNSELQLILEWYTKNNESEWNANIVQKFHGWTPYDKEEVLKEAEFIVDEKDTIYIEEDTFWEESC